MGDRTQEAWDEADQRTSGSHYTVARDMFLFAENLEDELTAARAELASLREDAKAIACLFVVEKHLQREPIDLNILMFTYDLANSIGKGDSGYSIIRRIFQLPAPSEEK